MRAKTAALVLVCLFAHAAQGQDAKQKNESGPSRTVPIKTDFSYFTNSGLRMRTFSLQFAEQKAMDGSIVLLGRIIYVLEFDHDVRNYDLESLQRIVSPQTRKLRHIFFDDDNVAMNSGLMNNYFLYGDVSGVSGEAFRIVVEFTVDPKAPLQLSKKLVVRPG